eukprot:5431582-Pleurochrysis_carterae.AAC.4
MLAGGERGGWKPRDGHGSARVAGCWDRAEPRGLTKSRRRRRPIDSHLQTQRRGARRRAPSRSSRRRAAADRWTRTSGEIAGNQWADTGQRLAKMSAATDI